MERWKLTYAINDGSGMFGLEPAQEETLEAEIASENMEEQAILAEMRSIIHHRIGEHIVLTDAEKIAS